MVVAVKAEEVRNQNVGEACDQPDPSIETDIVEAPTEGMLIPDAAECTGRNDDDAVEGCKQRLDQHERKGKARP